MTATMNSRSTAGRWASFYAIGGIGFLVQLVVLGVFVEWVGLGYLTATALATETAVLHNFVWHECWTWRDRTAVDGAGLWRRLLRFNAVSGTVSVAGNVVFTGLFASLFGMHYIVANVLAIATCSALNFLAADRFVFVARQRGSAVMPEAQSDAASPGAAQGRHCMRTDTKSRRRLVSTAFGLVVMLWLPVEAAELKPRTVAAWSDYVDATEARIAEELAAGDRFLVMDAQAPDDAAAERAAVRSGRIVVTKMRTRHAGGREIDVPKGAIHHWRGAMFVPDVTLDEVLANARRSADEDHLQEDVLESRILSQGPDTMTVFLKVKRKKLITVVFNTEHAVE